jgi:hypothetical protein
VTFQGSEDHSETKDSKVETKMPKFSRKSPKHLYFYENHLALLIFAWTAQFVSAAARIYSWLTHISVSFHFGMLSCFIKLFANNGSFLHVVNQFCLFVIFAQISARILAKICAKIFVSTL